MIDVHIDEYNKVIVSVLDKEGTLHTLPYKFVEELNHDLSAAHPSQILKNRAQLVPDKNRPTKTIANALKSGHLKAQVDVIPAPQKVSTSQNINHINLQMPAPAATQ